MAWAGTWSPAASPGFTPASRRASSDAPSVTHPTIMRASGPPAPEVDAGMDIVLKVKGSCPEGCDLRGRAVNVIASDGALVASSEFADFADRANETAEFTFKAPHEVGEYS